MLYCLVLSSVQNKTVSYISVRSCANLILVHNLIKKSGMCNSVILNWSLCTCWIIWGEKNHPLTDPVTGGLTLFHKLEWCGPAWSGCVGAKVSEQTINCPENILGVNILPVGLIEAVLLNPFEIYIYCTIRNTIPDISYLHIFSPFSFHQKVKPSLKRLG